MASWRALSPRRVHRDEHGSPSAFYNECGTCEQWIKVLADADDARADQGLAADKLLKEKLIKIGAKVVRHGRCIAFQMAEVAKNELTSRGHTSRR
jgi:hypothetical protein